MAETFAKRLRREVRLVVCQGAEAPLGGRGVLFAPGSRDPARDLARDLARDPCASDAAERVTTPPSP